MGVYHFMGLGRAVGTITCAVDYIEKSLDMLSNDNLNEEVQRLFGGSGGINHDEDEPGKIEALVLFTSTQVINRDPTLPAFKYKNCDNPNSVREEVMKVLSKVWKRRPKSGAKVFWCEVDIDDYKDCFEKAIQVAYRFSPPEKQGKEIWCNMTGGTNSIQLALLSMARLTGSSTKHYLISQKKDYREEIFVPNSIKCQPGKDGYFNLLPFIKLSLDSSGFYVILKELSEPSLKSPIRNTDLLSRLKNKQYFIDCSLDKFIDDYLLKLYGLGYTQRFPAPGNRHDPANEMLKITDVGYNFLLDDLTPLEDLLHINSNINMVEESKKWNWFYEDNL